FAWIPDAATVCRDFFNRRLQVVLVLNWGAGQFNPSGKAPAQDAFSRLWRKQMSVFSYPERGKWGKSVELH
ncbi:hypothetical protein ACIPLR_27565, partial [Herbaspirillum huttiense]|uniref:hypothetical protein n=1 Tax=Herbaspirillum huttiense TaxID=863372 RepID=UPI00380D4C20